MNYPRHNVLVLCDWINLLLAVAIVAVGAYRTWGIESDFINRMDIVVITAVGSHPDLSSPYVIMLMTNRQANQLSFSCTSLAHRIYPPSDDITTPQQSL